MESRKGQAVIIGAGPAGLTCATELLQGARLTPVILEMSGHIGGISRTEEYKGCRIDMGGHRFFSKSDAVTRWWLELMPLQGAPARDEPNFETAPRTPPDPEQTDRVMLRRRRLSSILHLRQFFDYPLSLNRRTLGKFGFLRLLRIGASYLRWKLAPRKPETSLEDFVVNRFGRELYRTFFRDYTFKVWGVHPRDIPADWGAQRIKGLSLGKALANAVSRLWRSKDDLEQKRVETSLIDKFYYPKLGPGQLWQAAAERVQQMGGEVRMRQRVVGLELDGRRIRSATVRDEDSGETWQLQGDHFVSTMPVRELVAAMGEAVPQPVRDVALNLEYRDFLVVGLLVERLRVQNHDAPPRNDKGLLPESWIYIQESDVTVGRVQIYNNWSPYMVADPETIWLGLEYFCNEGDEIWSMDEAGLAKMAAKELEKIGFCAPEDVLDSTVSRVAKAYPGYFGAYKDFGIVREFLDSIENLYCIGRNGMHRYNNMDHSMLTAMEAARCIAAGITDKRSIWDVNTEQSYHEEKGAGS